MVLVWCCSSACTRICCLSTRNRNWFSRPNGISAPKGKSSVIIWKKSNAGRILQPLKLTMTSKSKNFHVVLTSRPEQFWIYKETAYPGEPTEDGVILVKNLYLSLDPALRCRLNEETGVDYVKSWRIGETADGFGGIGEVINSNDPDVFGLTGLTAYLGVKEKGSVVKGANQTMVVSAAAGLTGSFAGQIAKAMGCSKVVGTCGSDAKVKCLIEELGFDAGINYKTENLPTRLRELCPGGVDIYFDNVGGQTSNEIIEQMNENSHIVLCGQIADYNKTAEYPPPIPQEISDILKAKNITRDRFLVLAYQDQFVTATQALMEMYGAGKIKVKETVEIGLENAGKAFVSMMRGGNIGKQVLKVSS